MNCLKKPNLPDGRIASAIISPESKQVAAALEKMGVKLYFTRRNEKLPEPTAYHADINCLHLGGNKVAVLSEQRELVSELRRDGFEVIEISGAGDRYPSDCLLNCLIFGEAAISHQTALGDRLRAYLSERDFSLISSKQGYCRCCVALAGERAAITADDTLYDILSSRGTDCLLIKNGEIRLSGYEYGFIGGSCMLIDKDTLAFFGKVSTLSCCNDIIYFCKKHGIKIIELCNDALTDIGGAVILTENNYSED